MPDRLSAYLDAMGVERWVLRSAEQAQPNAQERELMPDASVATALAAELPAVLSTVSLADFPANKQGRFLIVCGSGVAEEGPGSAFDGASAELLNAMLVATRWPAQECVLLADTGQLALAIETLQPAIVVAMGEAASQALLQGKVQAKRQQLHGVGAAKAIATYHPVQAQLNPQQYKRPIWEDLKLAMAEVS